MTRRAYVEYQTEGGLLAGIQALQARGLSQLEVYMPFPVHDVDRTLKAPSSRLPWLVFALGMTAAGAAYFLQWLLNYRLYPLNVGSRPPHFFWAYVPITFEMGVLFSAFTAFAGVLVLSRLLRLWHPIFEVEGFESASKDAYWITVASIRDDLDLEALRRELEQGGATRVIATGAGEA